MKNNKLKASFAGRTFKGGIFTIAISIVAIIAVVLINVAVGKLNLTKDLTKAGLYSIGSESKSLAKSIKDRIRIYYFATIGAESEYCFKIAQQYDGLGKDMKLVEVDPLLHPNYAAGLLGDDTTQVASDTIIVVNETNGRTRTIHYEDMMTQEITGVDYTTNNYTYSYYSNAENKINSALLYVTAQKVPAIYYTSGHGETALTTTMTNLITDNNMTLTELDLLTKGSVPEECDILLIHSPEYDFTEDEIKLVKEYLAKGKKALINVSYLNAKQTNLKSLLDYYGLELGEGLLVETDSRYFVSGYPYFLLPNMSEHTITEGVKAKKRVLAPYDGNMTVKEELREGLSVTAFLTTLSSAFSKVDAKTNYSDFISGVDIKGPFVLGAAVSEKTSNGEMGLVVYASAYIWDDSMLAQSSYGNSTLLIKSFKYLAEVKSEFNVAPKDLNTYSYLSITQSQAKLHMIIKLILLPVACVALGIIILVARRRSE